MTGRIIKTIGAALALMACGIETTDGVQDDPPNPMVEPPQKPTLPEPLKCAPGQAVDPGPSIVRRLTREEYDNTVRDLFGFDLTLAKDHFPTELVSLGFDNNARALQVSPLHAEQFMEAAEVIAAEAARNLEPLLPCQPVPDARACAAEFIESFGRRAWRRPLREAEVARMLDLYDVGAELGAPVFVNGVQLVLEAFLQSPNFLYRVEEGTFNDERGDLLKLSGYEVASRLSYLIWRSMPDADLFDAAEAGELDTRDGVVAQVDRMLADPKARAGTWSFFSQWLHLNHVDAVDRDPNWYPEFNTHLRDLLEEEARRLVESIVWDAGDLRLLLSASHSFMNGELADFYGLQGPTGNDFEKVTLDPNRRSGVLTTGALMAVTAKPNMTSPVHRGIFIREQLLCTALPPPPADLAIVAPDPDPDLTTRETFTEHSSNPACAGCHSLIDDLGFGFEHYDALGRFRITENGKPIDAAGTIIATDDADGNFDGAPELARRLADSQHVHRCMTTQAFRYAYGRGEAPTDDCARKALYDSFTEGGYSYDAMVRGIVASDAFRFRRPDPETPLEAQ